MALPEMAVIDVAACCLAQTGGWNLHRKREYVLVWQLLEGTSFLLLSYHYHSRRGHCRNS